MSETDEHVETPWTWAWGEDAKAQTAYEVVDEVEWSDEPYEFDLTRVYQHKNTGALYYATDSGCSCPMPFEDTLVSDLHPIARMQDWVDHVNERLADRVVPSAVDQAERLRKEIVALLKKQKGNNQ